MKIKDISPRDIQHGKLWKVVYAKEGDWLDWQIQETARIGRQDIVVHSGVIVEAGKVVHPYLETKYCEDGGEVGESAVFVGGKWKQMAPGLELETPVEGPFLAHVSTLDIHEYQKGSFDNRPEHYAKFWHYAPQIGKVGNLMLYPLTAEKLPAKFHRMALAELVEHIKAIAGQIDELHSNGKVAKGNRLVDRLLGIVRLLKSDQANYPLLKALLQDSSPAVVRWMQFQLADIFEEDCIQLIHSTAKEDSLHGVGARHWLKLHGYEPHA